MRNKMGRLTALVLAGILLAASLAGCESREAMEESVGEGAEKSMNSQTLDSSAEGKKLIYVFINNRGDLSYWDSMAEGGDRAKIDYADRADVRVVETTGDIQANLTALYEAADNGADLIVTAADFKDNLIEVALNFPDIAFAIINEDISGESDNIYCADFSVSEATFLGGIVAADLASQGMDGTSGEKTIGFIGGLDEAVVIQEFMLGYIQGAKFYEPETKVICNYVGGWNDPDTARTQAMAQYKDAKADVIFACAGGSGNGVHRAAGEVGKYVIGVDSNQALMYAEDKDIQERFTTSVLKKVGNVVWDIIGRYLDKGGLPFGEYEVFGLEQDAVGLVEDEQFDKTVSAAGKEALKKAKEGIISGEIEVEGAIGKNQEEIKSLIDQHINQ